MSWAIKLQAGTSYLKGMSEIEGQSTISAVQFLLAFFSRIYLTAVQGETRCKVVLDCQCWILVF